MINWKRAGGTAAVVVGLIIAIDGLTDIRQGLVSIMPAQVLAELQVEADRQAAEQRAQTTNAPAPRTVRTATATPPSRPVTAPAQVPAPREISTPENGTPPGQETTEPAAPVRTARVAPARIDSPDRVERTPLAPQSTPVSAPERIVRTPQAPAPGGSVEPTNGPMADEEVKVDEPAPKTRIRRVASYIKRMCR